MWYSGNEINRATELSAGFDLRSNIPDYELAPMERRLFETGTKVILEVGTVGFVCPRSGLALKSGITVLNAPGVIDADYRGDVGVILINLSKEPYLIRKGDRIAQLVVAMIRTAAHPVDNIEVLEGVTVRGAAGFGSTGV